MRSQIQIVLVVVNQLEWQHDSASLPPCVFERKLLPQKPPIGGRCPKNPNAAICGNLFAMRRTQAILVILALLATPLALLARAIGMDSMACNGMCCLPHGPHHAMAANSPQRSAHDGMSCEHGALAHIVECTMKPGHQRIEYGFVSPLAPTRPSALASIETLNLPRVARFQSRTETPSAGFAANPFQPPRS